MNITVRQFAQINNMYPPNLADMDYKTRKKVEAKVYARASAVVNYLLTINAITDTGKKVQARGGIGRSSVVYSVPAGAIHLTLVAEGTDVPEDTPYPEKPKAEETTPVVDTNMTTTENEESTEPVEASA